MLPTALNASRFVFGVLPGVAALALAGCASSAAPTVAPASAPPTVLAPTGAPGDSAPAPVGDLVALQSALESAAQRVSPSVVSITSARSGGEEVPAFLRPFGPGDGEVKGVGSGVIVDARGYVLTNNHVVEGATRLVVRLHDDRELDAVVVGRDPKTDVAVIEIEADDLAAATLADSDDLRVGQWVMAAGSPFGLPRTVTAGIVSAVGRGAMGITDYGDFIQTDAAVNQGNSGGPLIDLEGRVVGINTAIASRNGGSNGIGFTIPINLARNVMNQLIADGVVRRGWLGIVMGELTPELAGSFGFSTTEGILINDIDPQGPARAAGVRIGDIITRIDGVAVEDMGALRNLVSQRRPESEVELAVWRAGGEQTLRVRLGTLPGDESNPTTRPAPKKRTKTRGLGVRLEPVPTQVRKRYQLRDGQGALVTDVVAGSVASKAGIVPGDVLLSVSDTAIASPDQARRALDAADLRKGARVRVQRGLWGRFVVLKR